MDASIRDSRISPRRRPCSFILLRSCFEPGARDSNHRPSGEALTSQSQCRCVLLLGCRSARTEGTSSVAPISAVLAKERPELIFTKCYAGERHFGPTVSPCELWSTETLDGFARARHDAPNDRHRKPPSGSVAIQNGRPLTTHRTAGERSNVERGIWPMLTISSAADRNTPVLSCRRRPASRADVRVQPREILAFARMTGKGARRIIGAGSEAGRT